MYSFLRVLLVFIVSASVLVSCRPDQISSEPRADVPQQKTFKRETLEFAFAEMKKQTDWKLDKNLTWGFFFTAPVKPPLVAASKVLESRGYRVVSIYRNDKDRDWWLHVEAVGTHSIDSLHRLNQEFVSFAKVMNLGTYDGWDVGPVEAR